MNIPVEPARLRGSVLLNLVGALVALGVLAFIGWGLWLAYHPAPVPLQGQVEARTLAVSPKISARIATVPVREGEAVTAGTVLVTLDSPEVRAKAEQATAVLAAADAKRDLANAGARSEDIRAAKALWEKANAGAEYAEKTWKRVDALYKEGLVPLQRADEAETGHKAALETVRAARAQYDMALAGARPQEKAAAGALARQAAGGVAEVDAAIAELHLKAPQAAEVDTIVLRAGELAAAGFPVVTLVDLADAWVVFNVREDDFGGIRVGGELNGVVPALDRRPVALTIDYISPRGDYATWRATRQSSGYDVRTFEVRARPKQPVEGLRPGMSVLVEAR